MPLDFGICDRTSVAKAEPQGLFVCCELDVPWRDGAWCVTTSIGRFLFYSDSISPSSQVMSN